MIHGLVGCVTIGLIDLVVWHQSGVIDAAQRIALLFGLRFALVGILPGNEQRIAIGSVGFIAGNIDLVTRIPNTTVFPCALRGCLPCLYGGRGQ